MLMVRLSLGMSPVYPDAPAVRQSFYRFL